MRKKNFVSGSHKPNAIITLPVRRPIAAAATKFLMLKGFESFPNK
jgi:hypothetical protein